MSSNTKKRAITICLAILAFLAGAETEYFFRLLPYLPPPPPTRPFLSVQSDLLKDDIVERGSVSSYMKLKDYLREHYSYDIFYYALLMSNKYGYVEANYDVYNSLISIYKDNPALGKIDSVSNVIAFEYLKRGATGGDTVAIREWEKVKRNRFVK